MRIALITDPHTGTENDAPFDIDLRQNFKSILNALETQQPDQIIVGGDLCLLDGNLDIYRWQKAYLDRLDIPYWIIAGNHDQPTLITQVFDHLPKLQDGELFYDHIFGNYQFLFLDTSKGRMSTGQKKWLDNKLKRPLSSSTFVIMHHPPDLMHVPHMDLKHFLQDKDEVMQLLRDANHPIEIFCGHYHVEKTVSIGHLHVHITPSCYFQIDATSLEFRVDHTQIAYRMIDLYQNRIEISLHYIAGHTVLHS